MAHELIGKRLGGCDILAVVGRGGMAIVYRAHQLSMNRPVAIKILPRQFVNDETYMQRFEREVQIVAQLEHRNIVPVYDYGMYDGQPFIVMRYMDDGSVDDLIARERRLSMTRILDLVTQIAPALDYAHVKGVLHRDLKPSNILLDDDGGAYLTDFGIARLMNEPNGSVALTLTGVIGTPSYMSPEQAQGKPLDGRSDVYALGVTIFEMATGARPFEGETPYSIAVLQVTSAPPPPRSLNPSIPPAVEAVILRAMRKHPDDRYPTALALAEALAAAIAMPLVDPLMDTQPNPSLASPTTPSDALLDPMRSTQSRQRPTPPPAAMMTAPPAMFTPASAFMPAPASMTGRRAPKRRSNTLLIGVLVGGAIGCALLALLASLSAVLIGMTAANTTPTLDRTAVAGSMMTALTATPSPLSTSLMPTRTSPGGLLTPVSVGARSTATGIPGLGALLFCAERDGSFDIYRLDLATRIETRLTNDPGHDMFAVASPDGGWIAFQSDRDGDFDIYIMRADGSEVRRVTDNAVTDRQPAWTPDGSALIFASDTRGDGAHDLYRVGIDGGDPLLIYSDGGRSGQPKVSADGRLVIFTNGRPDDASTWDIKRLDLETDQVISLTDNAVKDSAPSFSADGGILYVTEGLGYGAIARMDADGEQSQVVYDGAGYEINAAAHPDGAVILFTSDMSGRDELYLMDSDGRAVRQLTDLGASSGGWVP
ncbi:MAG: protein kinase [Chloroflexota bacterium]|nr:protein kinase [Chloroflexota bacterium]